jgi:anti-anti-sigma factor
MKDGGPQRILDIRHETTPLAFVVRITGEIDLSSQADLRKHLMRHIGQDRPIIADCSRLDYLDAGGTRVLEECCQEAARHGQRFVLVASSPTVHRVIAIVELNQRIPVVHIMEEAVELLTRGPAPSP